MNIPYKYVPPNLKSGRLILVDRDGRETHGTFTASDPVIVRNGKRYAFGVATYRGTFYYEVK